MLPKGQYDPQKTEPDILKYWEENKFYQPEFISKDKLSTAYVDKEDKRQTYTNILPPPNANANLHLGHMSGYGYQDLMGRYQRMRGKKVLLLPGKDHAGIQTEVVFERELDSKGKSKYDLGRETFYNACYKFCMEKAGIALKQEQNLGLSADFERELFTLNPKIVDEILTTFIDMYNDELIYRSKRLINWCPRCQSALADIDTEYQDAKGQFVWFKYGFTEPDKYAVEIKNKYTGKEIEAVIERVKGMKHKTHDGKEFEWEFDYYGYLPDEKNEADGEDLDVIFVGYEDGLKPGAKVKGKAIGIMLRLDKDYKLIVQNTENTELNLKEVIKEHELRFTRHYAGVHVRLFDEYPEDKFYNNGFVIGTVRPETKFGDTAIAVDPDDKRYSEFVDKEFDVITLNGQTRIKVIGDNAVDENFGSGALKVTPAHAKEDWDIASRHPEVLPEKQVINFDGKLNHLAGKFEGINAIEARKAIIEEMKKIGMIVRVDENYENRIQVCERCKHQIEPLISYQWFLNTIPLKAKAKKLVEDGFTNIMPEGKQSVYLNWMDQPEDWCITRQLWWGYRVPVWYKEQPEEYITESGEVKEKIGDKIMNSLTDYKEFMRVQVESPGEGWYQDEDVLDTWFSSGQWPVVTLLAREGDFEKFYPTQVMETGWDILIFWITRMMLLCPYKAEKQYKKLGNRFTDADLTPFKYVHLHGLVLDKNGAKMSKSKGNGIDPFAMMSKYGTDALRLSFVVGNRVGQNYRLYEEKIEKFRNYCNKIWNVSKFTLMNIESLDEKVTQIDRSSLNLHEDDKAMIEHIDKLAADTSERMEKFNFGIAAEELYQSLWHEFADVYLEKIKSRTYTKDKEGNEINTSPEAKLSRKAALWTLWYSLDKYLRLLHPFVPFITERVWKEIPKLEGESETLMYAKWP